MHDTSSTLLSDAMVAVHNLNERLDDAWLPYDDRMGLLACGSIMLDSLTSEFDPDNFTEEEVDLVNDTITRINDALNEIMEEIDAEDFEE